ncbi:hypothetical protein [Streptomyces sp. c-19]|uniref:hypothetical protein n=1 Tax=Streptomyces sp. c-19 TaxID=2789275 RepID=UPI003980C8F9
MASAPNQTQKLGTTTPAGARLENTSQFLLHVIDDLVRSEAVAMPIMESADRTEVSIG